MAPGGLWLLLMLVVSFSHSLQAGPTISFRGTPTPSVTTNGLLGVGFTIANTVPTVVGYWVKFSRVNPTNGETSSLSRNYYRTEGNWHADFVLPCLNPETGWRIRAEVDFSDAVANSDTFAYRNPARVYFQSVAVSNKVVLCLTNVATTNVARFGTNDTIIVDCTMENNGCRNAEQWSLLLQFMGPITNTLHVSLPMILPGLGAVNWFTNLPASSFPPGDYSLLASTMEGNGASYDSAQSSFVVIPLDTAAGWGTNQPAPPQNLRQEPN